MKKINFNEKLNAWTDECGNIIFKKEGETFESASLKLNSLIECYDCTECSNCRYCNNCVDCTNCFGCEMISNKSNISQ